MPCCQSRQDTTRPADQSCGCEAKRQHHPSPVQQSSPTGMPACQRHAFMDTPAASTQAKAWIHQGLAEKNHQAAKAAKVTLPIKNKPQRGQDVGPKG